MSLEGGKLIERGTANAINQFILRLWEKADEKREWINCWRASGYAIAANTTFDKASWPQIRRRVSLIFRFEQLKQIQSEPQLLHQFLSNRQLMPIDRLSSLCCLCGWNPHMTSSIQLVEQISTIERDRLFLFKDQKLRSHPILLKAIAKHFIRAA